MKETVLLIVWLITFIAGWVCLFGVKRQKDLKKAKVLRIIALCMFGIAVTSMMSYGVFVFII